MCNLLPFILSRLGEDEDLEALTLRNGIVSGVPAARAGRRAAALDGVSRVVTLGYFQRSLRDWGRGFRGDSLLVSILASPALATESNLCYCSNG